MNVVLRLVKSFSGPPLPGVEVRRPGTGLADPAGVGVRRDRVADVLQRVEDVLGAVLDAVLVAGDQAAGHPAVEEVLALVVELAGQRVDPLDQLLGDAGVVAQPDRAGDDEDVAGQDARGRGRARRRSPSRARACRGRRRSRRRGRSAGARSTSTPCLRMIAGAGVDQPLGVARLRAALEGAVDEGGPEAGEVVVVGHASLLSCSGWSGSEQLGVLLDAEQGGSVGVEQLGHGGVELVAVGDLSPRAPHSSAYAAQSGLVREVCQTG